MFQKIIGPEYMTSQYFGFIFCNVWIWFPFSNSIKKHHFIFVQFKNTNHFMIIISLNRILKWGIYKIIPYIFWDLLEKVAGVIHFLFSQFGYRRFVVVWTLWKWPLILLLVLDWEIQSEIVEHILSEFHPTYIVPFEWISRVPTLNDQFSLWSAYT